MWCLGYFTLPVGQYLDGADKNICIFPDVVAKVLHTAHPEGPYQLYQCSTDGTLAENIIPIERVLCPILLATPRVYLDTSAVSYLSQEDSPKSMAATHKFWESAKQGKLSLYLSDITLEELYRCPEPKRTILFDFLRQVPYTQITAMDCPGIDAIVKRIKGLGIFPKRSDADVLHVAVSIYAQVDVIASWNFKHLSNKSTVDGIRSLIIGKSNSHMDILTPEKIVEVYL